MQWYCQCSSSDYRVMNVQYYFALEFKYVTQFCLYNMFYNNYFNAETIGTEKAYKKSENLSLAENTC